MFEKEIKAITLFFYFALLDDKRALSASTKAVDLFYDKIKKNPQINPSVLVILITQQIWKKSKGNFFRGRPHLNPDSGWQLPENFDFSPWIEFQKISPEEELLAVIWALILKYPEDLISTAIGSTQGTIRYRLGRALRRLGALSQSYRKLEAVRS